MLNEDARQLGRCIDIIAKRCRNGIPALVGDAPQPSDREIYEALNWKTGESTKSKSGPKDKIANQAVNKALFDATLGLVPWSYLVAVCRKFSRDRKTSRDWLAYRLHCVSLSFAGSRFTYATQADIAAQTQMSKGRVSRVIRRVPVQLAALALSGIYVKSGVDTKR